MRSAGELTDQRAYPANDQQSLGQEITRSWAARTGDADLSMSSSGRGGWLGGWKGREGHACEVAVTGREEMKGGYRFGLNE